MIVKLHLINIIPSIEKKILYCTFTATNAHSVDCPSATTNNINVILKLLKLLGCLLVSFVPFY